MMERPLLTPDELKSIPKGNFIVQKTGQHPMRTRLRLFLEWGITFEKPYIVPERADRAVAYANREDLERNLPQSNKAENADMRGAYAVSGRGGIAHEPAVDKPRRRGGKQMKPMVRRIYELLWNNLCRHRAALQSEGSLYVSA